MSDAMIPSEDAIEQNQPVTDDGNAPGAIDALTEQGIPDAVAEGDAVEQAEPIGDEDADDAL